MDGINIKEIDLNKTEITDLVNESLSEGYRHINRLLQDYEEASRKIQSNRNLAPRASGSPHLLGGLLKCGRCGYSLTGANSGTQPNRYRVYRCSKNKVFLDPVKRDQLFCFLNKNLFFSFSLTSGQIKRSLNGSCVCLCKKQ